MRIFPLYYAVLALAVALAIPPVSDYLMSLITYTSNLQAAAQGNFLKWPFAHFWSLAVEEQFYLLWPTVVLFLPRRLLPYAVGAMVVAGPLSRLLVLRWTGSHLRAQLVTTSCLDTLGAGALLALLLHRGYDPRRLCGWCGAGGLALLATLVGMRVAGTGYVAYVVLEDSGSALLFTALVYKAAKGFRRWGKVLEWKPLVYIGTVSYGVYVWHGFVPALANWVETCWDVPMLHPPSFGAWSLVYVTALSLLLASLSWYLLEKPLNSLKRHFAYAKPQDATVVSRPVPQVGLVTE